MKEIKMPFDCMILDLEDQEVRNPFSGATCMLTPKAVAVYDCIMGGQMTGDYKMVRKGLEWFRKNYPSEYMTLLD